MMRATCNLPSRLWKIIAYPYQGCNRSTGLNSVGNSTHSVRMVELFREVCRLYTKGVRGEAPLLVRLWRMGAEKINLTNILDKERR
jgi:hypothetical protein